MTMDPADQRTLRSRWFGWVLWSSALLLLMCSAAVSVWLIMPAPVARWVCQNSPWFLPAYQAGERGHLVHYVVIDRFASSPEEVRFVTRFLAERLAGPPGQSRTYVANFLCALFIVHNNSHDPVDCDPEVRQRLIAGLLPMIQDTNEPTRCYAITALLYLKANEHLAAICQVAEHLSASSRPAVLIPMAEIDDPHLTPLLLSWFAQDPIPQLIIPLARQSDQRTSKIISDILHTPGHPRTATALRALYETRCTDPNLMEAAAKYCLSADPGIQFNATVVIKYCPAGLPFILSLRCDPAAVTLHHDMDEFLLRRKAELTPEQHRRWLAAPALP